MNADHDFAASLAADGYADLAEIVLEPDTRRAAHGHPFDVRGRVLSGEFYLFRNGAEERYAPGDTFTLERDCEHYERAGPAGATYLVGRRH